MPFTRAYLSALRTPSAPPICSQHYLAQYTAPCITCHATWLARCSSFVEPLLDYAPSLQHKYGVMRGCRCTSITAFLRSGVASPEVSRTVLERCQGSRRTHIIGQLKGELRQQDGHGGHQADLGQGLAHAVAGALRKGDVALGLPAVTCSKQFKPSRVDQQWMHRQPDARNGNCC